MRIISMFVLGGRASSRAALQPVFLACLLTATARAAVQGSAAPPRQDLPGDTERRYEAVVTNAVEDFTGDFRGTVDGVMTRMPVSYAPYRQGWQPNVSARIENVGETDVVNPWITVNGCGDWRTLTNIVAEATRGCTNEAEKARAIWEWERGHRFHATTWDREVSDAVKALNVYGYTLCGDEAQVLRDLWRAAGFRTRPGHPIGHVVTEVSYDGAFHLMDSDENVLCLMRDNRTIASEPDVVRDHDLMKRTHTYSISAKENPLTDQSSASLYYFEGERPETAQIGTRHAMHFTLRPGESLEWHWSHVGKEYSAGIAMQPGVKWTNDGEGTLFSGWGQSAYDNLRNGKWIYRPSLDKPLWSSCGSGQDEENIACRVDDGRMPKLHPAKPGQMARMMWHIASPYVIVGGTVQGEVRKKAAGDALRLRWSSDGTNWCDLKWEGERPREPQQAASDSVSNQAICHLSARFDTLVSPRAKPMYEYYVQVEMKPVEGGDVGLDSIVFDSDVQISLLGMPELTVGANRIRYTDDCAGTRKVLVTHTWMERTTWHPPAAPTAPEFPADGAVVEGATFTFRWPVPVAGDPGDSIADYRIQVSDRADLRWPVSPTFDRLTSLTPAAGKPEWTIPRTGLLNPDTDYFWRVRARDSKGVWGAWTRPFKFRCAAPGLPVNLRVVAGKGMPVTIEWDDTPAARKAVAYRVYGSDEQGFTASDVEYVVRMGHGFCMTQADYEAKKKDDPFFGEVKTPPNFIAETRDRRFLLTAPVRAFYRVVAVDEKGNVSGPSDFVELPRPVIYSQPVLAVRVGQPYSYRPAATASIGHLTCHDEYNAAFWQRESLTWTLTVGPAWLGLADGVLSGTPTEADVGVHETVLKVVNNKAGAAEQRFRLVVEK